MAYASLSDVRTWLGVADTFDDPELALALDAAHAAVDAHVGHGFSLDTNVSARVFRATGPVVLDLAAVGSPIGTTASLVVATDDDDDGTYETTWTSADYVAEPLNGIGQGGATWARTQLRAVGRYWPDAGSGRARVQITARWGWPAVPNRVKLATIMLTAAWHQRRATLTGRSNFDGFFASAIADDQTISDLLAPFRHGTSIVGVA